MFETRLTSDRRHDASKNIAEGSKAAHRGKLLSVLRGACIKAPIKKGTRVFVVRLNASKEDRKLAALQVFQQEMKPRYAVSWEAHDDGYMVTVTTC